MREYLIEIKQDMPGFNRFFGPWVCQDKMVFLVDLGPANAAEQLIHALLSLGLQKIDYVLLTHIHLDHMGGLAQVLERYPMARVICHEKAVDFLVEPSRLWEGSLKVLGEIAKMYGAPEPVPADKLIPHTENPVQNLLVMETPGHAPHHLSFSYGNRLFVGEAGGNYLLLKDQEYLRPATPPKFLLEVFLRSIDGLLALEDQPIYYGHYGKGDSSARLLRKFRSQLLRWGEIVCECMDRQDWEEGKLLEYSMEALFKKDPDLAPLRAMDTDTQNREKFFINNSIKGFIGYYRERSTMAAQK